MRQDIKARNRPSTVYPKTERNQMLTPTQIALLVEVSDHARNPNAVGPYAVRPLSRRTAQVLIRERFVKEVANPSTLFPGDATLFIALYY
jgi:hypothetical protein